MHPTLCLTRADVAFYDGNNLLDLKWRQPDRVEVRFPGHKGDQAGVSSIVDRTRDEASGARSGLRSDGTAVALMVELLSCGSMLPKHTSVLVLVTGVSERSQLGNTVRRYIRLDTSLWSRRESRRNSHCILFELGGAQHSRQGRSV